MILIKNKNTLNKTTVWSWKPYLRVGISSIFFYVIETTTNIFLYVFYARICDAYLDSLWPDYGRLSSAINTLGNFKNQYHSCLFMAVASKSGILYLLLFSLTINDRVSPECARIDK